MKISHQLAAEAASWVARRDAGFTAEDQVGFERWRSADPQHEAALRLHEKAWGLLGAPAQLGKEEDLQRLLATAARRRTRRKSAALAGVLTLALGAFLLPIGRTSPTTAVVVAPERTVLPDGSVAELKKGARILVHYSPGIREVKLESGEVHFEVVSDKARPFVVTTAGIGVRAVGTGFAVQREPGRDVEVVVSHGIVAVESERSALSGGVTGALTLEVGKLAQVDPAHPTESNNVRSLDAAELNQRLEWRTPRIEFSKASLETVVALFNQHRRSDSAELVVIDPELRRLPVSGAFRADNADGFVSLLENAFGLGVEEKGHTITIQRRSPE